MAGSKLNKFVSQVVYFQQPGRENLPELVKTIKHFLKRHEEAKHYKIVVFTAHGEGAALAYSKLKEFAPSIIAVTFPLGFALRRGDEWFHPTINDDMRRFFEIVGVRVLTPQTLPFENISGMEAHNQAMRLAKETISIFGPGFIMCVQAVLRACDMGWIEIGETVIAFSADTAAIIRASSTAHFLQAEVGLRVEELLCKPYATAKQILEADPSLIEAESQKTSQ